MTKIEPRYGIDDLLDVMAKLRDPDSGCPWDLAQNFESIVPSTLEECYELASAIEGGDYDHVAEELGDVLFQVVFYSQLGLEQSLFRFEDVVHVLVSKLIRRHPHVFASNSTGPSSGPKVSMDDVATTWESIKQSEREQKSQGSILDDVPVALPALPRAQKMQKRAARVGFDWDQSQQVLGKLHEELRELEQAMQLGAKDNIEEELGDLLFSCVNIARHLDLDAEASLRKSNAKFESRFARMEAICASRGGSLDQLDNEELDTLWESVKAGSERN